MQFALVDGKKTSPIKGMRGTCNFCGGEMIAKCGQFKMWHWAHLPKFSCDPWWGPETVWHREWKNRFPSDWQEVVHVDEQTGERHIADVRTPDGLVIEFQHSPMDDDELVSREKFYQNMIWIVDGDRGSTDPAYFNMGRSNKPILFRPLSYQTYWMSQSRLLHKWSKAMAPVFIDFGDEAEIWRFQQFWPEHKAGAFSLTSKDYLVEACQEGERIPFYFVPEDEEEEFLSRQNIFKKYSFPPDFE